MVDFSTHKHFIKICGVTTVSDATAIAELGASSIGLVLSASTRRITIHEAAEIVDALNGGTVSTAVVRDESMKYVLDCVDATRVDAVQVHGVLHDELLRELRDRDVKVIKALSIDSEEFGAFDNSLVDAILIDGPTPGSGQRHRWPERGALTFSVPYVAAGGLTPDNVAEVISQLKPWGVDVATGVETSPGVKDLKRVSEFIDAASRAFDKE